MVLKPIHAALILGMWPWWVLAGHFTATFYFLSPLRLHSAHPHWLPELSDLRELTWFRPLLLREASSFVFHCDWNALCYRWAHGEQVSQTFPPVLMWVFSKSSDVYKSFNDFLNFSQRNWSMCKYIHCIHGRSKPLCWHLGEITQYILVISGMIMNPKVVEHILVSVFCHSYTWYILFNTYDGSSNVVEQDRHGSWVHGPYIQVENRIYK